MKLSRPITLLTEDDDGEFSTESTDEIVIGFYNYISENIKLTKSRRGSMIASLAPTENLTEIE